MLKDARGKYFDLLRTLFWVAFTFLAWKMNWLSSVVLVSLLSIWALAETAWSAYRSEKEVARIKRIESMLEKVLEERSE